MTLTILIALMMSAFREAQADESVMISLGPYPPECVEGKFLELRVDEVLRSFKASAPIRVSYVPLLRVLCAQTRSEIHAKA
jgi:hypothetical protein